MMMMMHMTMMMTHKIDLFSVPSLSPEALRALRVLAKKWCWCWCWGGPVGSKEFLNALVAESPLLLIVIRSSKRSIVRVKTRSILPCLQQGCHRITPAIDWLLWYGGRWCPLLLRNAGIIAPTIPQPGVPAHNFVAASSTAVAGCICLKGIDDVCAPVTVCHVLIQWYFTFTLIFYEWMPYELILQASNSTQHTCVQIPNVYGSKYIKAELPRMPLGSRTSSRPRILDILVNIRCDHYGTLIRLMSAIYHHQSTPWYLYRPGRTTYTCAGPTIQRKKKSTVDRLKVIQWITMGSNIFESVWLIRLKKRTKNWLGLKTPGYDLQWAYAPQYAYSEPEPNTKWTQKI